MKKQFIIVFLITTILSLLVSCSKNDENVSSLVGDTQTNEFIEHSANEPARWTDPSAVIAALEEEYGIAYNFNTILTATPVNVSSVRFYVVPSMWNSSIFLTFVLDGSANILGLYDFQVSGLDNSDTGYDYTVSVPCSTYQLFSGWIAINVAGPMPNHLYVYSSSINIPSDYPYPIFANVTSGYVSLENYSYAGLISPQISGLKLAFHAAATFYANFYE